MSEKKSFIVFCDRIKELELLSNEECGQLFKALIYYVSTGQEFRTASLPLKLLFSVFKSQIDENSERYQKKKEANAEYYRNRKKNKNNSEISENSDNSEISASDTVTVTGTDTVTVTVTDTGTDNNILTDIIKRESNNARAEPKQFKRPSLKEVEAYCKERKSSVNPKRFFDYYESNGWKVGKVDMIDWKAALRNWESNGIRNDTPASDPDIEQYKKVINQFLPL